MLASGPILPPTPPVWPRAIASPGVSAKRPLGLRWPEPGRFRGLSWRAAVRG